MRSRPLLSCLLLALLALPVAAGGWTRHENRELVQNSRAGWALETPADWVAIPDVQPPPPLGLGFRSASGDSGVIVTFLERLPQGETDSLVTRGYQESSARVAGHDAKIFARTADGATRRVAYLKTPSGTYRLMLFGRAGGEETMDKVLRSFQLVTGLSPTGPAQWTTWRSPDGNFSFSHPADWTTRSAEEAVDLVDPAGKAAIRVTLRKDGADGQSFRGYARGLGFRTIPGAASLERFEPVVTDTGSTGYVAVWKTGDQVLVGPVAYMPLPSNGQAQAVEALLLDPALSDTFFRILRSYQATKGS